MHVVLLDRASPEERERTHDAVKENSSGWYHHQTDTWIVRGKTAAEWRDILKSVLDRGPSNLLVFTLPEEGARSWAYWGPNAKKRGEWLHRNY